jgi:hypothetical protein
MHTESNTPATTETDNSWLYCHRDHGETPLDQMTIAEMFEEWRILHKWDHKTYDPKYDADPCPNPDICRCERIWAIEEEFTQRRPTCAEDVLCQFTILEHVESGRITPPAIAQKNFYWGGPDAEWSARLYFDREAAAKMLRQILLGLHDLARAKV